MPSDVFLENLDMIECFKVTNMSESVEEMRCKKVVMRVPDHSLLQWDIVRDGGRGVKMEEEPPEMEKKCVVPED